MNFGINLDEEPDEEDIFYDEEKLSTGYIPEEMPHREDYQEMMFKNIFRQLGYDKQAKKNYIIYGKPGTGKTMVVKSLIREVEENSDQQALDNFETIYINCSSHSSYSAIFAAIGDRVGVDWKNGIPKDQNKKELLRELNTYDKKMLVILDEMDELKKKSGRNYIDEVLYTLTRPHEEAPIKQTDYDFQFNFICISNDPQITEYMESWNESTISHSTEPIEFQGYKKDEITEILKARQEEAFDQFKLDQEALEIISEEVFEMFDSDIRKALGILRNVPDKIEEQHRVPQDNIDQGKAVNAAVDEFKENYIEKVLQSGDRHFLLLMSSFYVQAVEGKKKAKYIQEAYWDGCEKCGVDKRSESFIQRGLQKLVDKNLVDRRRDYNEGGNPYKYEPNFDLEVFRKKVKERMERYGYWSDFREGMTAEQQEYADEAEEKMKEMGVL